MEIYTDNWFKYVRDNVLAEGLRDIGLPEFVIDYIEDAMPNASEKGRMYIANNWKKSIGGMAGAYMIDNLKYEIVSYLIDNALKDYVIYNNSYEHGTTLHTRDPVARVVPPYDINKPRSEREEYDEERLKQNEQIKFVIINLRNTVARPMGTWRKAFMKAVKALSKSGLPSEKVEEIKEYLRSFYSKNFHFWINKYSELVAFLNDDATNYELIKDEYSLQDANDIAIKYLDNKEDPANIMHTFDDGSYWYNLNVSSCDVEAARMGHCGSDSRGVLVSLRKKQDKRRESSSYVTMTWDDSDGRLWQIKGRNNDAPPEEVWDHIAWFINNVGVNTVEETGEHSNDYDGFVEMNQYLASRTNADFHGSLEDRLERAEEYCANVEQRYIDNQDELEYGSIGYNLEEEGNDVYCFANASYTFEIDLGWSGYSATDTGFKSDDGDFKEIPRSYGDMREFYDELGVDEMMYEMPGDDGDFDFDLVNLIGVQPDSVPAGSEKPTTHIRFTLYSNETLSVDEDGEVPEFDEFADNMLAFEEDSAPAYRESIRQALAAGDYMNKSAYDRSREELMKITNLDKWHVKQAQGGLEFDWTADDGQPLHPYTGKFDSSRAQMYGTGTGNVMGVNPDAVFREVFGYGPRFRFANMMGTNDYSVQFARELSKSITAHLKSKRSPEGQQAFEFGEKYKDIDPTMILADDTDFVVFNDVTYSPGGNRQRYPEITIKWLYRMRVSPQSEPDEFEVIEEIAAFLNENEELVTAAADKIIAMALEGHSEKIERKRNTVMGNQQIQDAINKAKEIYGGVLDQYGDEEGYGSTAEIARKVYAIITWFEENYADMDEPQRYIMVTKFLIPMLRNTFRSYSEMGEIDRNTGRPVMFDELVPHQVAKMGGQPVKMRTYNESIEDQIERIERFLSEAKQDTRPKKEPTPFKSKAQKRYKRSRKKNSKMYRRSGHKNLKSGAPYTNTPKSPGTSRLRFEEVDIRLYKMQIDAVVSADRARGGSKLLQDELRSITGVTVISVDASRDLVGGADLTRFNVKFSLQGQAPRMDFVEDQLLPALRRVAGFEVKDWSAPEEVTPGKKLRENTKLQEYGFGGLVGNLGAFRRPEGTEMVTPRMSLQSIVDDWAEGGVMAYDVAADTTDMRYTVMMPTEELLPYMSREYRGDMKDFHGRYQNFIKDGPTAPVYIAIGMNGRVKITGNEDLVWFAKKAGLEQVPVFLSYQKQA